MLGALRVLFLLWFCAPPRSVCVHVIRITTLCCLFSTSPSIISFPPSFFSLDYDNYSSDPAVYDDIRRLAAWRGTASRQQLVIDHYRYLRSYNPSASITVPFSKWLAVPAEAQCYANVSGPPIWGASSVYFSGYACGLVETAADLWADPFVSPLDGGVSRAHLGQQLQGAGDTAVAVFAAALRRNFSSAAEYADAVASLPPRLYAAAGARLDFIATVLASPEFAESACPRSLGPLPAAACTVTAAQRALDLTTPSDATRDALAARLVGGNLTLSGLLALFAAAADAEGLYDATALESERA